MCIFTTLPDSPEIWMHSCVYKQLLESLTGPVCYLHLIRSRNGRMSDLEQSGVGDSGYSVRVSCFMRSGIVNCSFPHSSQCSEGKVPNVVSPDSFPPCLFPFDNSATRNKHVMPRKKPVHHVFISLKYAFR